MYKIIILISGLLLSSFTLGKEFLIYGDIGLGGDTLVEMESGGDLTAGRLLYLAAGFEGEISDDLKYIATLGWKFDSVNADNGEASFDRFPLELMIIQSFENIEIGGGISYHLNPKYDIEVDGFINESYRFKSALGSTIYVGFHIDEQQVMGLRYTNIEYKTKELFIIENNFTTSIDGNSVALFYKFKFGEK